MTNQHHNDRSGALFSYLMKKHKLARDADLAKFLGTTKSYVSEIRNGRNGIGPGMLIRICEKSKIPLKTAVAKLEE